MTNDTVVAFTVAKEDATYQHDLYFVWFDPDKRYKQSSKLKDAIAAFVRKTGTQPREVLINAADETLSSDVPLRPASFVCQNYYYIPYPHS